MRLCTVCGVTTSRGSRCAEHPAKVRGGDRTLYTSREWKALSARVLARHRGQYGDACPGWQRDAHTSSDLTVDHITPVAAGGTPLDPGNLAVLCRSCNSSKGAALTPTEPPTERAQIRARYLG